MVMSYRSTTDESIDFWTTGKFPQDYLRRSLTSDDAAVYRRFMSQWTREVTDWTMKGRGLSLTAAKIDRGGGEVWDLDRFEAAKDDNVGLSVIFVQKAEDQHVLSRIEGNFHTDGDRRWPRTMKTSDLPAPIFELSRRRVLRALDNLSCPAPRCQGDKYFALRQRTGWTFPDAFEKLWRRMSNITRIPQVENMDKWNKEYGPLLSVRILKLLKNGVLILA